MSFSKIVHMWLVQGCFKHHPWGRQHSILVDLFITSIPVQKTVKPSVKHVIFKYFPFLFTCRYCDGRWCEKFSVWYLWESVCYKTASYPSSTTTHWWKTIPVFCV